MHHCRTCLQLLFKMSLNILILSNELLLQILADLDSDSLLYVIPLVNQRLKVLSQDYSLFRRHSYDGLYCVPIIERQLRHDMYRQHLRYLRLDYSCLQRLLNLDSDECSVLEACSNLELISVSGETEKFADWEPTLQKLRQVAPALTELRFSDILKNAADVIVLNELFPQKTKIRVFMNNKDSDVTVLQEIHDIKMLVDLHFLSEEVYDDFMEWAESITSIHVDRRPSIALKVGHHVEMSLKNLFRISTLVTRLECVIVTFQSLDFIDSYFEKVEHLQLKFECYKQPTKSFKNFPNGLRSLKRVDIGICTCSDYCAHINEMQENHTGSDEEEAAIQSLAYRRATSVMKLVQALTTSTTTQLTFTDTIIHDVDLSRSSIKKVQMKYCKISKESLESLLSCPSLEELDLADTELAEDMDDSASALMSSAAPQLPRLPRILKVGSHDLLRYITSTTWMKHDNEVQQLHIEKDTLPFLAQLDADLTTLQAVLPKVSHLLTNAQLTLPSHFLVQYNEIVNWRQMLSSLANIRQLHLQIFEFDLATFNSVTLGNVLVMFLRGCVEQRSTCRIESLLVTETTYEGVNYTPREIACEPREMLSLLRQLPLLRFFRLRGSETNIEEVKKLVSPLEVVQMQQEEDDAHFKYEIGIHLPVYALRTETHVALE